ncbi:MAG: chorismate mutase [Candidatus Hadarchaeales archaeon]
MTQKKLEELRRKIDELNEKILVLLSERLKTGVEIAELKKRENLRLRDEARESDMIQRCRRRAAELGMDPDFAESVMRLTVSRTVGEEKEKLGMVGMWSMVQKEFEDYPAQLKVAKVLFKYGLRVDENGDIMLGGIKVPAVQVAKEAGVDRRVVDATAKRILENEGLRSIFGCLEPVAYLKGVAQALGLGLIEIFARDPAKPGVIREVTEVISKFGGNIRQAISDDPYFVATPKLTIITDEPLSGEAINALRKLPSVESVIVYG